MREIKNDGMSINIRASNLSRMFFYQEFGTELDKELDIIESSIKARRAMEIANELSVEQIEAILKIKDSSSITPEILTEIGIDKNPELLSGLIALSQGESSASIPGFSLMKVVWAMNKAEEFAMGVSTPAFDQWIIKYENFNFEKTLPEIYEEIKRGFFR